MNTRLQTFSLSEQLDAGSATGVILFDVYAACKPDDTSRGPEWVKLAPRGRFTARDGRQLEVDPELLVRRFDADGVDLPIDLDHATAKGGLSGDRRARTMAPDRS
jgi:phage I-like protein